MAIGASMALLLISAVAYWRFDVLQKIGPWWLTMFGVMLYIPAVGQLVLQLKIYKIISRTLLGMAVVVLWFGALVLLPPNLFGIGLRLVFITAFAIVWKVTLYARSRRPNNPCVGCREGAFPLCRDNLLRTEAHLMELKRTARAEDQPFVEFIFGLSEGKDVAEFDTHIARQD